MVFVGERVVGKVERITERIIENEQEVKELLSKQSIEDLYEFFLSKDSTLTAKEFDDEVYDILEYYSKNISESLEELEEIETKQIAGGKSDFIKKSLSASLCALTLNSGINVSASPVSVNSSSQNAVSILDNKNQQDSLTFGEKIKAWAIKNKKALIITGITVAVIAGIIIAVVVYKNKNSVSGTGTPPAQVPSLVNNTENNTQERPENHKKSAVPPAANPDGKPGQGKPAKQTSVQTGNSKQTPVSAAPAAQSENNTGQKTPATTAVAKPGSQPGKEASGASNKSRPRERSTITTETNPKSGRAPAVQLKNEGQPPTKSPSNTPTAKSGATVPPAAKLDGKPGQGTSAKPISVQTGNSKQTPVSAAPAAQSENNTGQKTPTTTAAAKPGSQPGKEASGASNKNRPGERSAPAPAANPDGKPGQGTSAKPSKEHKDEQQKTENESEMWEEGRVKRLKENLDGKILFVSPGGRPKTQSVVAGPTGSAADASGGRPKVQAAAAGGSTKDSANAFGGGPGPQSADPTGADARYTPSTTGNNLREAEKAMKNVHVGRLRAIFGQQDSPKSPTGGLNSEQNATLIKASVEAAEKNFMVEFFKVKQNIEVNSKEFDSKMRTLESLCKKSENKDWLFDQVNGALQSLNQDLVNMRKLQTQMGKGYLKGVDEEVRKELVNKMDEVSKKVESAKVGLNVVFGEEIKKIENWGKMLDELKTNALYVARDLIRQVTEGE